MYSELIALGRDLERDEKLPPAGFASYGEPIKWLVHLWPDHVALENVEIRKYRPFCGRTSGTEAHLLADEAGYALGASTKDDGTQDKRAAAKHGEKFVPLYRAFLDSDVLKSESLREAIGWLDRALKEGWVAQDRRFEEIRSKDWVSVMPEVGELAGTHLYCHAEAKVFWAQEMQRRCSQGEGETDQASAAAGACAVCGETGPLIRKLPLKVKLASAIPLHSLNLSAFTSYIGGAAPERRAHLGVCFRCGELSARAFNYLGESEQNRKLLVRHPRKSDSLTNQYALFWLKAPSPILAGDLEIELTDKESMLFMLAAEGVEREDESTLQEMVNLLAIPWTPKTSNLGLNDFHFYLALLSPNVGRIAMREWLPLSIASMKVSLRQWIDDTSMVNLYRECTTSPTSVARIVEALGSSSADVTRALLRVAYRQGMPPIGLLHLAGERLNAINAHEQSMRDRRGTGKFWDNSWPHALAGAIRLSRIRQGRDGYMASANLELESVAYHCGRLLAVMEEAQQLYTFHQMGKRLDVSIVQRGYGGASSTPATVLGRMYRLASSVHLPSAGGFLNREAESLAERIVELGGMPRRLSNDEQADFGLGFYQERARIRQYRDNKRKAAEEGGASNVEEIAS